MHWNVTVSQKGLPISLKSVLLKSPRPQISLCVKSGLSLTKHSHTWGWPRPKKKGSSKTWWKKGPLKKMKGVAWSKSTDRTKPFFPLSGALEMKPWSNVKVWKSQWTLNIIANILYKVKSVCYFQNTYLYYILSFALKAGK